jgi:hypothetical protein
LYLESDNNSSIKKQSKQQSNSISSIDYRHDEGHMLTKMDRLYLDPQLETDIKGNIVIENLEGGPPMAGKDEMLSDGSGINNDGHDLFQTPGVAKNMSSAGLQ